MLKSSHVKVWGGTQRPEIELLVDCGINYVFMLRRFSTEEMATYGEPPWPLVD